MIRRKNTPRRKGRKRSTKMVRLNCVSFSSVLSSSAREVGEEREREREILILENLSFSPEGFALGFSVASDLGIIDGKAIALNVIQLGPVVCFVVAFGFCVV